jgi:hypothetical protein
MIRIQEELLKLRFLVLDRIFASYREQLSANEEQREPYNSAQHNLLSLQLPLAACQSSDQDGAFIEV